MKDPNDNTVFYAQQDVVHGWAKRVFISERDAESMVTQLCFWFNFDRPKLLWEAAGAMDFDTDAVAIRNERTDHRTILFAGSGCDLLTLLHELVHCIRPWEEDHHEQTDWDLCTILLEECRDLDF